MADLVDRKAFRDRLEAVQKDLFNRGIGSARPLIVAFFDAIYRELNSMPFPERDQARRRVDLADLKQPVSAEFKRYFPEHWQCGWNDAIDNVKEMIAEGKELF